jgi:glycosyltransferase involved in cell wall biosynthesis
MRTRKKVAIVIWSFGVGGSEKQACLLAAYLKESESAEVTVCALYEGDGALKGTLASLDVRWTCVGIEGLKKPFRGWLMKAWALRTKLAKMAPDVIIAFTAMPNILGAAVWRTTSARIFIWNQRDANGIGIRKNFLASLLCLSPTFFISNSDAGKAFLAKTLHVRPSRIAVIRNGTEPAANKSEGGWREKNGIDRGTFVAAMIANLTENKDHKTLLEAWSLLAGLENSRHVRLVLIGRNDTSYKELVELADRLNIRESVAFAGPVVNVAEVLHDIDLCVHCSNSEGNSNAVIEAMMAGLPVVGTDVAGMREVVGEANFRYLSTPNDPSDLAAKMSIFIENERERQQVGAMNRASAMKKYSYEAMGKAYADLLESLFRGRRA